MLNFLKSLKTSQLTKRQTFVLALVVVGVLASVAAIGKLREQPPAPAVNASNSGVEVNSGATNKGQDSRSGSITVTGSSNTINQNSTVGK